VVPGQQYVTQIPDGMMGQQQQIQTGLPSQMTSHPTSLPGPQTLPGMSSIQGSSLPGQAGVLPGIHGDPGNSGMKDMLPQQTSSSKIGETRQTEFKRQPSQPSKPASRVAQTNLQKEITSLIFDHIMEGDIDKLQSHQQRLKGYENPEDVGRLIDTTCYHQNALFVSCVIKNEQKAQEMTKYLIN